jgi:hypothetical protein
MNDIICPFGKIRLIWACFKTEAILGPDWIRKRAIRAQFGAGLVYLRSGGLGFCHFQPSYKYTPLNDAMPDARKRLARFSRYALTGIQTRNPASVEIFAGRKGPVPGHSLAQRGPDEAPERLWRS